MEMIPTNTVRYYFISIRITIKKYKNTKNNIISVGKEMV